MPNQFLGVQTAEELMDKAKRKELSTMYKLAFPSMGVFSIRNLSTGKQLIGQSMNLPAILNRHRVELRMGVHRNSALMADWRALGEEGFSFDIVEQIKEKAEPDFDYQAELEQRLASWLQATPLGSSLSYL